MSASQPSSGKDSPATTTVVPIYFLEDAVWGDWPHVPHMFAELNSRAARHTPLTKRPQGSARHDGV